MGLSEAVALLDSSPGRCWGKSVSRGSCAEMSTSSGVLGTVRRWVCPGHSPEEEAERRRGWGDGLVQATQGLAASRKDLAFFFQVKWESGAC